MAKATAIESVVSRSGFAFGPSVESWPHERMRRGEENGRASHDAHISKSRYGAPGVLFDQRRNGSQSKLRCDGCALLSIRDRLDSADLSSCTPDVTSTDKYKDHSKNKEAFRSVVNELHFLVLAVSLINDQSMDIAWIDIACRLIWAIAATYVPA